MFAQISDPAVGALSTPQARFGGFHFRPEALAHRPRNTALLRSPLPHRCRAQGTAAHRLPLWRHCAGTGQRQRLVRDCRWPAIYGHHRHQLPCPAPLPGRRSSRHGTGIPHHRSPCAVHKPLARSYPSTRHTDTQYRRPARSLPSPIVSGVTPPGRRVRARASIRKPTDWGSLWTCGGPAACSLDPSNRRPLA